MILNVHKPYWWISKTEVLDNACTVTHCKLLDICLVLRVDSKEKDKSIRLRKHCFSVFIIAKLNGIIGYHDTVMCSENTGVHCQSVAVCCNWMNCIRRKVSVESDVCKLSIVPQYCAALLQG